MWPDLGAVRDGIIFGVLNIAGGILWTLDRILIMLAAVLHWFRILLVGGGGQDNLLGILMTQMLQGNELLKQLVYLGLLLAFTMLAFTLIARPLIGRFQAVEVNRVILWFFVCVLVFSAGPGMVAGVESARLGLQEQAHLIASSIRYTDQVNRYNNGVVPSTVGDFWLPGQTPGQVPHLFGADVGSDCPAGCNGLDAAAAFLGAEEGDITGERAEAANTGGYPAPLYSRYFTWREGSEEERAASVKNALDGVMRLLEGILPAFFSVVEAAIFLLFGMAALVLFVSLPAALPFAFFSLTEVIAASVLRAYLFLVLRTFVVATMLAFLVQMLIIFAERGTALVFIAISVLTMMLSFQFVHMAANSVTAALNVIGSAVGSATGISARQTDPSAIAGRAAGMATMAGMALATGGGALFGAAALMQRQGGLRGGGISAVGSAALQAARSRAGGAIGRTPLRGFGQGYNSVQRSHEQSRAQERRREADRALLLDRDAEEAAAILAGRKRASRHRKTWAENKLKEWTSNEAARDAYRDHMKASGMERLVRRVPVPTRKSAPVRRVAGSSPLPEVAGGLHASSAAAPVAHASSPPEAATFAAGRADDDPTSRQAGFSDSTVPGAGFEGDTEASAQIWRGSATAETIPAHDAQPAGEQANEHITERAGEPLTSQHHGLWPAQTRPGADNSGPRPDVGPGDEGDEGDEGNMVGPRVLGGSGDADASQFPPEPQSRPQSGSQSSPPPDHGAARRLQKKSDALLAEPSAESPRSESMQQGSALASTSSEDSGSTESAGPPERSVSIERSAPTRITNPRRAKPPARGGRTASHTLPTQERRQMPQIPQIPQMRERRERRQELGAQDRGRAVEDAGPDRPTLSRLDANRHIAPNEPLSRTYIEPEPGAEPELRAGEQG